MKLPPEVADVLRSLAPAAKRKVRAALQQLRLEPELGDPVERELIGLRRVRVGQLRIVYRLSTTGLEILAIGPRSSIYTELERQARQGT